MRLLNAIWHGTFSHGVHPPQYKEETAQRPIRRLPFAPRMVLPLNQHIGRPALPRVVAGQEIWRGEPIAEADGHLSVPLHAPVSGVVESIRLMPTAQGPKAQAIVVHTYAADSQEVRYGTAQELDTMTPAELIMAVQQAGLVGLGGAAFPSHVKLSAPSDRTIDTLLANGCECEPFLTTDHRAMLEQTADLIRGIGIAMRATGAKQAVIGVEDNKPDVIHHLQQAVAQHADITVAVVRTKYPQGAEKLLIKATFGREVPSGGHSYDVGVVSHNVGTLAAMGRLLPQGQGLIERVITVAGPGIDQAGNYLVAIGTPLRFILEQLGLKDGDNEVITGGPMMGSAVASLDVPVTKGTSGILVLNRAAIEQEHRKIHHCIKCARCVQACPMHLNPSYLGLLAAQHDYQSMEQGYHLNDCFECGACSYVCPAGIPLVQYFRIAKAINREQRSKVA